MRPRHALGLAALALGLTASAPAQLFSRPGEKQQLQLGKQAAAELRKKERVLPSSDPRVQTLRRVAQRILSTFHDRDKPWEYSFDVIESKEINAFALPGGPTFFYTGLMDKLKTEDELAAVLGHELTHVRKEHWSYAYRDQQQRQGLLTLGAIILRPSRDVLDVASIGSSVLFDLPFSRKHESEADQGGFDAMVRAGYNPQGMVDVFTMLQESAGGGRPPEWLSDHPSDGNRIKNIRSMISQSGRNYPPQRPMRYRTYDQVQQGTEG